MTDETFTRENLRGMEPEVVQQLLEAGKLRDVLHKDKPAVTPHDIRPLRLRQVDGTPPARPE